MASGPQPAALPPAVQVTRFWTANRRWMLLASLVVGLDLFFIWLPSAARAGLLAALQAQVALVSLLSLFALVAISLVWPASSWTRGYSCSSICAAIVHARWIA